LGEGIFAADLPKKVLWGRVSKIDIDKNSILPKNTKGSGKIVDDGERFQAQTS